MLAPGGSTNKLNANPPRITFRMVRGRVIPIVQGKQPRGATRPLRQEFDTRVLEVKQAERGMRGVGKDEHGHVVKNFGTKSTFPQFFGDLGFNSKKQFLDVASKKTGRKYEDLVNNSVNSLLVGRNSTFGDIPPNEKFRLATKQEYNNKGVIFRKMNGKVVPLRPKYVDDGVPF